MIEVNLKPASKEDASFLLKLKNDHDLQEKVMCHPHNYDLSEIKSWIERYTGCPDLNLLIIRDEKAKINIGYINLHRIMIKNRTAYFGIIIDPQYHGRGYGRLAINALLDFAQQQLSLRKLLLEVVATNNVAHRMYKNCSFRDVGVLKNHFAIHDQLYDVVIMEKDLG